MNKELKVKTIKEPLTKKLEPKRLRGFSDWFAQDMKLREFVIGVFKNVFESYGYEPLETPALEYTQMMLDISGDEAESMFYRFKDSGNRDVMLKYEVMTGMCRAVAQNINNLPMPYKRYQIQQVWRSENTQRGRYREFTQCDADTIGTSSMQADAEFIEMGIKIIKNLGFQKYVARISNRKFLQGVAEYIDIPTEKMYGYFMSIDKLPKIGVEKVIEDLVYRREIIKEQAEKTIDLINPENFKNKTFKETVECFKDTVMKTESGSDGLQELLEIDKFLKMAEFDESYYIFDTSIARGLASYTGPVWEFDVIDGGVGSIAGCGRYDKLIGRYIGRDIPATGGSFGIERICDIIKDRKMMDLGETTTDILVTVFSEDLFEKSLKIAKQLREKGLKVMIYPEFGNLGKQFKYADKKGIQKVVVLGPEEDEKGIVKVKDMKSGYEKEIKLDDISEILE